jgi:hypothetical protein
MTRRPVAPLLLLKPVKPWPKVRDIRTAQEYRDYFGYWPDPQMFAPAEFVVVEIKK